MNWLFRRPRTLRGLLLRMATIVLVVSLGIWQGIAGMRARNLTRADVLHRPDWCALPQGPCPERQWALFPDLTREHVELQWKPGHWLRGWYLPSVNGKLVLLLHDYRGNASAMLPLAAAINADGTGVLAFDLPGHGRSDGEQIRLNLHDRQLGEALWQKVSALPEVEPEQIAVAGQGLGAALALTMAEENQPGPAMVLLSDPLLRLDSRWVEAHTGLPAPLAWWVWLRLKPLLNQNDFALQRVPQQEKLRWPLLWLTRTQRLQEDGQWLAGVDVSRVWLRLNLTDQAEPASRRRQLDEILLWMRAHWPPDEDG